MPGEGIPGLAERMLAFIAKHPGVRLSAIEEAFGISRIEAGRMVHWLMDQGRVRRDEDSRQYYPI